MNAFKPPALGFKASETLLGIETFLPPPWLPRGLGFKASETLLGIETNQAANLVCIEYAASKPLKPF